MVRCGAVKVRCGVVRGVQCFPVLSLSRAVTSRDPPDSFVFLPGGGVARACRRYRRGLTGERGVWHPSPPVMVNKARKQFF